MTDHGEIAPVPGDSGSGLFESLRTRGPTSARYRMRGEVGRGGMGAVFRVYDRDLGRYLAMKVLLDDDPARLSRFLEEAQVAGQLDHPGFVPVHEVGLDPKGRVFFTMKLVKGETLVRVFERVKTNEDGWSVTRAIGALLRVCEAMAFAHEKRVVHRDLKPANVMVGRHGEVLVMDWGLARVVGADDAKRDADLAAPHESIVRTERRDAARGLSVTPSTPQHTAYGDVVGTPCYMAIEQAEGRLPDVGPQSDVYSVGAMLYHLLAGRPPYSEPGEQVEGRQILERVLAGPPRPIDVIAVREPGELHAICAKAMARRARDRYGSMQELAADLRAYLEDRVVSAYESGPIAELRKWVRRNRGIATLTAGLVLVAASATAEIVRQSTNLARANRAIALARDQSNASAHEAEVQTGIAGNSKLAADREVENVRRLADRRRIAGLVRDSDAICPATPKNARALHDWLSRADELLENLPLHEATLRELRATGARKPHPRDAELDELRASRATVPPGGGSGIEDRIAKLEALVALERDFDFGADDERAWWHDALRDLVIAMRGLLADDAHDGTLRAIEGRLRFAESIEERSVSGPAVAARWAEAREAIRVHPLYGGLDLAPQMGLVPLGADPRSSLFEFAHVATGEAPVRNPRTGIWIVDDKTCVVLVLIPGRSYRFGAQASDRAAPCYDPNVSKEDEPVRDERVAPYLISKYEMTQAQWTRITGSNPSNPDFRVHDEPLVIPPTHPVEFVTWTACDSVLRRVGLRLPTEVQWEAACRAGTETPWWTGRDPASLRGAANLADLAAERADSRWLTIQCWLDDGYVVHAPVGRFGPNPFGLHDVAGNVSEWCADPLSTTDSGSRALRGGSFFDDPGKLRSAARDGLPADTRHPTLGCRPARAIE